jgi:hypothetical protein
MRLERHKNLPFSGFIRYTYSEYIPKLRSVKHSTAAL